MDNADHWRGQSIIKSQDRMRDKNSTASQCEATPVRVQKYNKEKQSNFQIKIGSSVQTYDAEIVSSNTVSLLKFIYFFHILIKGLQYRIQTCYREY